MQQTGSADSFDVDFYHYSHLLRAIQSKLLHIPHRLSLLSLKKASTQAVGVVSITLEIV